MPVMEQYPQNLTVLDGKDATVFCKAVGAPTPNVTWIYNGIITITTHWLKNRTHLGGA
jgi:protein sidekick